MGSTSQLSPLLEHEIERVEIDGVPVFWADVPGPARAALVFRVGRADESLATSGLTHLVEHLALFAVADDSRRANGFVDHVRTAFHTHGAPSEVNAFLASVAQALHALPLDRFELEKRVLLTEAASAGRSSWEWLMALRFGAAGFGLVDYPELGLHRARPHDALAWAESRFAAANAAIWMTTEPPPTLGLELPAGRPAEPPPTTPIAGLALPAYVPAGGGGVVCGFVGTRSTPLNLAVELLERRIHERLRLQQGLTYSVGGSYVPLGPDTVHVALAADCLDDHARDVRDRVLDELRRLAADGPLDGELERAVEARVAHWAEADSVDVQTLDAAATNELLGAAPFTRAELIAECEAATPAAVSAAVAELLPTAILCAPTGDAVPAGFVRYEPSSPPPVEGRRYRRLGGLVGKRSRVAASELGVTFAPDAPQPAVTVLFADAVAAIEHGPGRVELVARNGASVRVDATVLRDGTRLLSDIRRGVPSELFVPMEPDHPTALDLSRLKIGVRSRVAREIERLDHYLQPGERLLTMAAAVRGLNRRGLLVLTDRRVLFLAKASSAKPFFEELPLPDVTRVKRGLVRRARGGISVATTGGRVGFVEITPRERAAELADALADPAHPRVTPHAAAPQSAIRAYAWPALLVAVAAGAVAAGQVAAVWLGAWGVRSFVRRSRRRREAALFRA